MRGFNYDHEGDGKLLEDYWDDKWPTVESAFREMKGLGANVVRIHLQFGKFMESPTKPRQHSLNRLARLVELAEQTELYINLTGRGCYHKQDVPEWCDKLPEQERWAAQAEFWEAVSKTRAESPAIFCYDLMNEPVVPGGDKRRDDWLGPGFGDMHIYPEKGKVGEAVETLKGFAAVGKPVIIEETFVLKCGADELEEFIDRSQRISMGTRHY